MHEGLSAGQNDGLQMQAIERTQVVFEDVLRDLFLLFVGQPDVAHHTATVAPAVWAENEHRQRMETVRVPGA